MPPSTVAVPSRRPSPEQARNWSLVQSDSIFVGIVTASGTFLPVFLVRLGGSGTDVGLLTALPALTALVLAIPFGRWLQRRRNIVPWYSRLRLVGWLSYAAMAVGTALIPADRIVPVLLIIWAVASLPSTAGLVAFPIVMDGAAGPSGRFDLLGRRWAIAGVATAVSVALGGQLLNVLPFPMNFEALFVAISAAGFGSFWLSRQLTIPDQTRQRGHGELGHPPEADQPQRPGRQQTARRWTRVQRVTTQGPFVRYELRAIVFTAGLGLIAPLLPLLYIHELHASDGWIGVIGASQSAGAVVGYVVARRISLRRGGARVLVPSLLGVALVPAGQAIVGWLPAIAVLAFIAGVTAAGAQLALFDKLLAAIPRAQGVTFSSMDQSIQNLGLFIAPNVGGLLAATVGVRLGLGVAAAVLGLALALFAAEAETSRRTRRLAIAVSPEA
jgi:hypothetical protein